MARFIGNPPPPGAIVRVAMFQELLSRSRSDVGRAENFCQLFGHSFRFDHSRKRWMVWTGLVWSPDADGAAERAVIDTTRWRETAAWLKYLEEATKEGRREWA